MTELATGERTFKLAKKFASASAFTRPLVCIYLDEPEYEALAVLDGRELRKHRYHRHDQGYRWAIDVFTGPLAARATRSPRIHSSAEADCAPRHSSSYARS